MSRSRKFNSRNARTQTIVLAAITITLLLAWGGQSVRSARTTSDATKAASSFDQGRDIFYREWLANDPRSHAGDGLGPLFNESSCVGCHNMGGAGGAGPIEKNVELLTATVVLPPGTPAAREGADGQMVASDADARELLAAIHPDFRKGDTVVVHRFGIDRDAHSSWQFLVRSGALLTQQPLSEPIAFDGPVPVEVQQSVQVGQPMNVTDMLFVDGMGVIPGTAAVDPSQFPIIARVLQRINTLKQDVHPVNNSSSAAGIAVLQTSQRNTSPLFGIGLIDAIPDDVIEAVAERQSSDDSAVSGRIHRLGDGRIGRFGWKAQKASLYDFTMAACAVELGLQVPEHAQSDVPYDADYEAPGLDLDQEQVDSLVAYLRNLPPPAQNEPEDEETRKRIERGAELFESAGCAACHVKRMGDVDGLFSDLLLHDLGGELGGVGNYGIPSSHSEEGGEQPGLTESDQQPRPAGPSATEWRTPPLWGVRDSSPYLHDGRAKTLETAIAFHSGEGDESRLRFFMLPDEDQQLVIAFLKTLTAPDTGD